MLVSERVYGETDSLFLVDWSWRTVRKQHGGGSIHCSGLLCGAHRDYGGWELDHEFVESRHLKARNGLCYLCSQWKNSACT